MNLYKTLLTIAVVTVCCLSPDFTASSSTRVAAQLVTDLPAAARGIGVEDRVGQFVPLDLVFSDERGNKIGLGKFFNKGKPILLTLNYSDCPGLCIAQLDNVVANLRGPLGQDLGERFEVVTVSIDPTENFVKAAGTKAKYVGMLRDTQADVAWHFLTGEQQQITKLANSVGFKYTYDKVNRRYNHAAVTYFLSSEGQICRYFVSLGVEPEQMKFAIAEAGKGELNETISDAFVQLCYMYDPDANRYATDARRVMAFGGAAFLLMVVGLTAPFWFSRGAAKAPIAQGEGLNSPANRYINADSNTSEQPTPDHSPLKDTHE